MRNGNGRERLATAWDGNGFSFDVSLRERDGNGFISMGRDGTGYDLHSRVPLYSVADVTNLTKKLHITK